jgi:hypothetical protein
MGLYDTVKVSDPRFVCSEGHDLSDEEFQTKDLEKLIAKRADDKLALFEQWHIEQAEK